MHNKCVQTDVQTPRVGNAAWKATTGVADSPGKLCTKIHQAFAKGHQELVKAWKPRNVG